MSFNNPLLTYEDKEEPDLASEHDALLSREHRIVEPRYSQTDKRTYKSVHDSIDYGLE